jgi:hypothetical protein
VAKSVAGGLGVRSVWRHGSGASRYEAQALWGYDATSGEVRVFEVNSLGVSELHMGRFDDDDALTLELHDPATGDLLQWRVFRWEGDRMIMTGAFYSAEGPTEFEIVHVRRPGGE